MRNCLYLVLALSFVFASVLQAQSSDARLEKLERICQEQEQQIQKLQERLGVIQDEATYKKYTESIVKEYLQEPSIQDERLAITAGYDKGFFVRDPEGNLEFKFTGFLQAGFGVFENNTFDNNGFALNGAYLNFDVFLMKDWHARLQLNLADYGSDNPFQSEGDYEIKVKDLYVEYIGIPELSVRIGNTHVPFSMSGQYAENEGLTIGSPAPFVGWSHGRDLGLMFHGVIADTFGYSAGIFNGEGSLQTNESDHLLMAGSVRWFYCGYESNPNNFFHIGALRSKSVDYGSADFATPWGRIVFADGPGSGDSDVFGWRTGVDAGFRFETEMEGGHALRVEAEFMYMIWERDFTPDGGPVASRLQGFGGLVGMMYRHSLNPEIEGSGLLLGGTVGYTDVDNKSSDLPGDIPGQRAYVYTLILGYAFNPHIAVNFNWAIVDLDNKEYYGTSKRDGSSGCLENAWFLQFTAQW